MTVANGLLLLVVAVLAVAAAYRLLRQARADRAARTDTERQLRHSTQLQQLTATLSRARTPEDVVRHSLPDLLHAANAAAGAVVLVSDDGHECVVAHAVGYDDETIALARSRPTSSQSVIAESIRRRALGVVERRDPRAPESYARASDALLDGHPGAIVVPLIASGRVLGACAMSLAEARTVDGGEREFLLASGRNIAQALDRARLYDEAERARGEAEEFRNRADAALRDRQTVEEALRQSEMKYRALATRTSRLYALSTGLSEAVTPEALGRVIVTRGNVVLGSAAGSVAVLTPDNSAFEVLYSQEYAADGTRPQTFKAEPGLCSTAAVTTQQPIFIGSFAEWQERYPLSASIAADGGYASAATLPLLANGRPIGVLSFYFTVPVNFDEEYKALLTSVAQHCAQALDRARMYTAAERARADAEAANRSKDYFLSTISHELRTPLNAILGWAAMLRSGSVDAARTQRALEAIFNNATRQGRLIEELLDVSRIVAGRAALDVQEVDLGENIRGAVESMMPIAAGKGVELRFEPASDVWVVADPRRLEQVFLNLLSNGVKFTPAGGRVTIAVERAGESVQVRVSDTGAGIEPAFLPHVFDRFRQADSSSTRGVGGLGLGLFIARHLVEAQDGTIAVESGGPDRGTTFTVSLPAPREATRSTVAPAATPPSTGDREINPALTGIRVLLVDDEPDAREMMAAALEACGATVVPAESVPEALHALKQASVDVVLADIAMPGQDGYELIRAIRSMPAARIAALPAAAVTACVREDERQRALAAGFQMHLAKPVHPTALARAVATLARNTSNAVGSRL